MQILNQFEMNEIDGGAWSLCGAAIGIGLGLAIGSGGILAAPGAAIAFQGCAINAIFE